ncbi:Anaphase-promoting complex subunit 10 [Hypsizygus marmoreus]|uniref:Anaphase-promoting complex subunit 10 n=1 Tax=Hypsizygus marmoreus TaxID=39966 RepID=A0A369KBB7_HYPMA|nr:Anaphase-promoting complex subunit 10 [Hypsizygus marmoreus]
MVPKDARCETTYRKFCNGTQYPPARHLSAHFPFSTLPAPPDSSFPWPDISSRGKWSVSSHKLGFGAECLLDDDPRTFWHSEGPQPHFITVEFSRKVAIQKLSLCLSIKQDDSYTPATLTIRAGNGPGDLQDVRIVNFNRPEGWITFDVGVRRRRWAVNAYVLQVEVTANYLNGKDTHIRGLRILGPTEDEATDEDYFAFRSLPYTINHSVALVISVYKCSLSIPNAVHSPDPRSSETMFRLLELLIKEDVFCVITRTTGAK